MGNFEKLNINNELTPEEQKAIDGLKNVKPDELKSSLKNEKLKGADKTFEEMLQAFTDYKVTYNQQDISDDLGNLVAKSGFSCDEKAPDRLKSLIADKDENDFAYLMYKVSEFLNVGTEGMGEKKLNEQTLSHLTALKTEILRQEITNQQEVGNQSTEENQSSTVTASAENVGGTQPEALSSNLDLKASDISFALKNGITPQDIVEAVKALQTKNPGLAAQIVSLLKASDIVGIQKKLGMEEGNVPLYKKADGKFGKYTLANLKAGQTIEKSVVSGNKGNKKESSSIQKPSYRNGSKEKKLPLGDNFLPSKENLSEDEKANSSKKIMEAIKKIKSEYAIQNRKFIIGGKRVSELNEMKIAAIDNIVRQLKQLNIVMSNDDGFYKTFAGCVLSYDNTKVNTFKYAGNTYFVFMDNISKNIELYTDKQQYISKIREEIKKINELRMGQKEINKQKWRAENKERIPDVGKIQKLQGCTYGPGIFRIENIKGLEGINFVNGETASKFAQRIKKKIDNNMYNMNTEKPYSLLGLQTPSSSIEDILSKETVNAWKNSNDYQTNLQKIADYLNSLNCWKK